MLHDYGLYMRMGANYGKSTPIIYFMRVLI